MSKEIAIIKLTARPSYNSPNCLLNAKARKRQFIRILNYTLRPEVEASLGHLVASHENLDYQSQVLLA